MPGIMSGYQQHVRRSRRWPGSTHDSFVWANSAVGEQAEREEFCQSLFLGDSGYPLRTYLFTSLTNPQTRAERAYNVAHVRTHNVVKCAIGIWKLRGPCTSCQEDYA
ncbi:putative nuclease HARBI1 [Pimephales promelas]|nr:putative nuclease HARBI1 [Pimephales promelas]